VGLIYNPTYNKTTERRKKMILNKHFTITYYANKHGKHITRRGQWTDKSRYWTSKLGDALMTYFDTDAQGYRTARTSWTVRY